MSASATQNSEENVVEAYKMVIEFNKIIISITSTILAALISFLVFQNYSILTFPNLFSPLVLLITIGCALSGIGHAIPAIKKNESRKWAVNFSNISGWTMLAGILLIGFIEKGEEKKINNILHEIEQTSKAMNFNLLPENCQKFMLQGQEYIFVFENDHGVFNVAYSLEKNKISSLQRSDKK